MKNKILLVDASGSMSSYEFETCSAIKSVIESLEPNTRLTLVYFDSGEYEVVAKDYAKNINPDVAQKYSARGSTPITDAFYKAIQDATDEVKEIESLSGDYTIILYCDGGENDSKYATPEMLAAAIEHMTQYFGWKFQFLGPKSEERSISQYAESIKIKSEDVTLYASMSEGLKEMKEKVLA